MPFPESSDVGTVMRHIKQHHPGWPRRQKVAAALNTARKNGADIDPYQEAISRERKKMAD